MRAGKRMTDPGRAALGLLALCASLAAGFTATASPAGAATCPNEAIREAQTSPDFPEGTVALPDCMALEMVSPPKKFVQAAYEPSFSLDGERVLYRSMAALADTPGLLHPFGDRYVATRSGNGWITAPTSPPTGAMIVGGGGLSKGGPNSFSPDLGRWLLLGYTQPQEALGIGQAFQGGLDGSFVPLSPLMTPVEENPTGGPTTQTSFATLRVAGASVDSSSVVLAHEFAFMSYFPDDPRSTSQSEPGGATNSYVASLRSGAPTLALLARDAGKVYGGRCGAVLGGAGRESGGKINQGAISTDGSRIYFTTRPAQPESEGSDGPKCDPSNPLRIMRRLETPGGIEIAELLPGEPSASGDDLYQGASVDGTRVYFTSPRKLVAGDTDVSAEQCRADIGFSKGCDLYLYDSTLPEGERVIQVSAGGVGDPTPGEGANVLSPITAVSGDGSHVYFVAQGVLTTDPNPEGDVAVEGQPNLYAYRRDSGNPSGQTAFVGTLSGSDKGVLWGSEESLTGDAYAVPLLGEDESGEETGGDGHLLTFASKASLTGDDGDGGFRDVFRYDESTETLERLSAAAPGGSDDGPFDVSVNSNGNAPLANFAGEGRWVSEDGETVAFTTAEALAPEDEDGGVFNPYFWKEGRLGRIAGLGDRERPPTVSLDGSQVAFPVTTALLPQDTDTASDAYLVRVNGGFPPPTPPTVCDPLQEGSCRSMAQAPLAPSAPATLAFNGPGNAKERPRCRNGFVKKRGKCAKKTKKRRRGSHGKSKRRTHR